MDTGHEITVDRHGQQLGLGIVFRPKLLYFMSVACCFCENQGLMTSFCATATPGFRYHFYVAHDHSDPFFRYKGSHDYFTKAFYQKVGL